MTKFVLHGGFSVDVAPIQEDDSFFKEILKETSQDNVKILLVYFAEREEMIELRIQQDKDSFTKNKLIKNIEFRIAHKETFIEDCRWADVVYLHGGRTERLLDVVKNYQNIWELFQDKIIGADSAGVNILAQVFFTKNSKKIGIGLKMLPFKVVVHYVDGTPNPLEDIEPQLETVFLREYETKVVYL